jgi:hypothetical protein
MRSLTYAEIAEALRITPESANRLARRKRWPRVKGNDGRTRVSGAAFEQLVQRLEAQAAERAIKPRWQRLLRRAG